MLPATCSRREGEMTITQVLLLGIAGLSVLLSADLLRSALLERGKRSLELEPGWRQVGTYGRWYGSDANHAPGPRFRGSPKLVVIFVLFCVGGAVFKIAWDETHPTVRSAYGRAYERCVAEEHISRWQV